MKYVKRPTRNMHDTSALNGRVCSCHRSVRSQNMQCTPCEKKRWSEKPKVPCCCPSTPVRRVRTRGVESVRCMGTRMYTGQGMPAPRSIESTLHACVPCNAIEQQIESDFHATHRSNKQTYTCCQRATQQAALPVDDPREAP